MCTRNHWACCQPTNRKWHCCSVERSDLRQLGSRRSQSSARRTQRVTANSHAAFMLLLVHHMVQCSTDTGTQELVLNSLWGPCRAQQAELVAQKRPNLQLEDPESSKMVPFSLIKPTGPLTAPSGTFHLHLHKPNKLSQLFNLPDSNEPNNLWTTRRVEKLLRLHQQKHRPAKVNQGAV